MKIKGYCYDFRYINGKVRSVIIDIRGNIVKNPAIEQIKIAENRYKKRKEEELIKARKRQRNYKINGFSEHYKEYYDVKIEDIYKYDCKIGVYMLTYDNKHCYIGSSYDIRSRLRNHILNPKCNDKLLQLDIFITRNRDRAYRLEHDMVLKYRPNLNKFYPVTPYKMR